MATQNEKQQKEDKKQNGPQSTIKKPATKKAGDGDKKDSTKRK
jgi:hypothetical protein